MLVKSILAFEKDSSTSFPLMILNHAVSFLLTESVIGGLGRNEAKFSLLIDFDDLSADNLTRTFSLCKFTVSHCFRSRQNSIVDY